LPARIDSVDKRILILLDAIDEPISRKELYRMIKELQEKGVKFGFKFIEKLPYSPQLEEKINKLVERGYLLRLYLTGESFLELYSDYLAITDKGRKIAKKRDVDKRDVKRILDYVAQLKSQTSS